MAVRILGTVRPVEPRVVLLLQDKTRVPPGKLDSPAHILDMAGSMAPEKVVMVDNTGLEKIVMAGSMASAADTTDCSADKPFC